MDTQKLVSIGVALLLVGSLSGVAVGASLAGESKSKVTGATGPQTGADGVVPIRGNGAADALQQGEPVNLSAVNVSALEAVALAQNRTEGKPVVVRLTSQNGTPVFNVTVLHENLSVTQVQVDATERSVLAVRPNITTVGTEFLGGTAFNYTELRTAGEAIRQIRNETTGTVVNVGIRRGELVYAVVLRTPDGAQTQALVTATDEPILGIRTANATTPAPNGS